MTPKAGAHGELCGMMAIKAALEARGEKRSVVLVPESAHGTNPATAALIGYRVVSVPAREDGTVDPEEVKKRLSPDVAAIMLTNPNTCGLFERDVVEIAEAVHAAGAFFYADGANFNAIVGKVRPGDLGVDAMHINLHKTFSTPHGGGGPGAGPVVLSKALAPFAPVPFVVVEDGKARLVEHAESEPGAQPLGRMCAFQGQMGMFIRAMSYMLSHGTDGMRQASEDAVLNANYVRACLADLMSLPFGNRACMHEALFDDTWLEGTGVTTLDFAKAMIDEGYHPMTVYFPLVVHGAMLVEPTESESKASLDLFIAALRDLAMAAKRGDKRTLRRRALSRAAPPSRRDARGALAGPALDAAEAGAGSRGVDFLVARIEQGGARSTRPSEIRGRMRGKHRPRMSRAALSGLRSTNRQPGFDDAGEHAGADRQYFVVEHEGRIVHRHGAVVAEPEVSSGNREQHIGEILAAHLSDTFEKNLAGINDCACDVGHHGGLFLTVDQHAENVADVDFDIHFEGLRHPGRQGSHSLGNQFCAPLRPKERIVPASCASSGMTL